MIRNIKIVTFYLRETEIESRDDERKMRSFLCSSSEIDCLYSLKSERERDQEEM